MVQIQGECATCQVNLIQNKALIKKKIAKLCNHLNYPLI